MESEVSIQEVVVYFSSKLKDTEYWDCFRNTYLSDIGRWNLWYEVLYIAWTKCDENSSPLHCMNCIAHEMDEWDL